MHCAYLWITFLKVGGTVDKLWITATTVGITAQ